MPLGEFFRCSPGAAGDFFAFCGFFRLRPVRETGLSPSPPATGPRFVDIGGSQEHGDSGVHPRTLHTPLCFRSDPRSRPKTAFLVLRVLSRPKTFFFFEGFSYSVAFRKSQFPFTAQRNLRAPTPMSTCRDEEWDLTGLLGSPSFLLPRVLLTNLAAVLTCFGCPPPGPFLRGENAPCPCRHPGLLRLRLRLHVRGTLDRTCDRFPPSPPCPPSVC